MRNRKFLTNSVLSKLTKKLPGQSVQAHSQPDIYSFPRLKETLQESVEDDDRRQHDSPENYCLMSVEKLLNPILLTLMGIEVMLSKVV